MEDKKLNLPTAIIILGFILGAFYCVGQLMKQKSSNLEYILERKRDCYNIEQSERNRWNYMEEIYYIVDNNYYKVEGSNYNEVNDICNIEYININWKEGDPDSCPDNPFSFGGDCKIEKYYFREF